MPDPEFAEAVKEVIAGARYFTGDGDVSLEEMAVIRPRLGNVMLDVGQRTWILYYAARAGNWRMARSQCDEIGELLELGAMIRPRYAAHLRQFVAEDWPRLRTAIENADAEQFEAAFKHTEAQWNAYHELENRSFIRWSVPDMPPPGYDLEPRETDRTGKSWRDRSGGGH
jgi:hypothetical protein